MQNTRVNSLEHIVSEHKISSNLVPTTPDTPELSDARLKLKVSSLATSSDRESQEHRKVYQHTGAYIIPICSMLIYYISDIYRPE